MPRKSRSTGDLDGNARSASADLEAVGHSIDEVLRVCREAGLSRDQTAGLVQRLAVRKTSFRAKLEKLTTRGLIRDIEEKLALIMHYLDEFSIAGASPRDLAIVFGILVEKRQLLLGEPTQILSSSERKHINELIPALVEEAKNRGMTIDLTPGDYAEVGRDGRTARVVNRKMLVEKAD